MHEQTEMNGKNDVKTPPVQVELERLRELADTVRSKTAEMKVVLQPVLSNELTEEGKEAEAPCREAGCEIEGRISVIRDALREAGEDLDNLRRRLRI